MNNPFEMKEKPAAYTVIVNESQQYSLWPTFSQIPDGWILVFGPDDRENCIIYIEKNWTDMRPAELYLK